MRTALILLLAVPALAACGGHPDAGTVAGWTSAADAAFAAGDRLARDPAALPAAVAQWRRAGGGYVKAFRLADPVPAEVGARALLAFRIGRAWSKSARFSTDEARRRPHGDRALFWFAHARRLKPDLRQVHFERALLFDSDIEGVRDPARAREAYAAYLAACAETGRASESELERLKVANERIKELAPGR